MKRSLELAFVASYVALDWLTYIQPVLNLGITPWSPQTGVAVAYLLIRGTRFAPVVALAAFLAEIIVRDSPSSPGLFALSSVAIAGIYAAVTRFLGRSAVESATEVLHDAARFAIATVVGALAAACAYITVFAAGGALPSDSALESIARYWVGDVNGILMISPLLLAAGHWREFVQGVRARSKEVGAQILMVVGFVALFFGFNTPDHLRFFYPLFVPVIWIACRWGALGALLGTLAIQIGLVIAMQDLHPAEPLIDLQFLMLTLCLTGLLLGAVVRERADALARAGAGEAELRALLSTAPDAVATFNPAGETTTMNAVARHLFRLPPDPAASPPLGQLLPGSILEGTEGRMQLDARRFDGTTFPAEFAWTRLEAPARPGWLVIVRDVTERLQAQAEARGRDLMLARAMRFSVAGELASALTHELNQPITALVTYLRASEILARPLTGSDARLGETLSKAGQEAIRAANVLKRLRDFYQGHGSRKAQVDLEACCETVARALESRIGESGISLRIESRDPVPPIHTDAMHVEIVLHNLMSNAIDALAGANGTRREILVELSSNANSARIAVEDSGPGIAPEARNLLFKPFNTTKPDGMGLGLAISRSLVRSLGGDLTQESRGELQGSRFCVVLPVA